jgi:hypothetical protein
LQGTFCCLADRDFEVRGNIMTVFLALITLNLLALLPGTPLYAQQPAFVRSPNGKLAVEFKMKAGALSYTIRLEDKIVHSDSRLGLVRDDEDFSKNMKLVVTRNRKSYLIL